MATIPPLPPPLEQSGDRRFSFYPPILNIEHNEWEFKEATWSEMLVSNTKSGAELWVPRRYVGEVSRVDEPVMIVGLLKELEYKAGQVWPHERRVLQIPKTGAEPLTEEDAPRDAVPMRAAEAAAARRGSSPAESQMGRLLALVIGGGLLLCVGFIAWRSGILSGSRVHYLAVMQGSYGLTAKDDYWSVVHRFGPPVEDRWQASKGEMKFRVLSYQKPELRVVLMGIEENDKARYIGALNPAGQVVDSVQLVDGRNTQALLHSLAGSLRTAPSTP